MTDKYTKEVLETQYHTHKEYVQKRITLSKELKINFRLPCIPEDISENIIKFAIHKSGNKTCSWNRGKGGDLVAQQDGHNIKIECKCFTSSGPLSFTPSSTWDTIYFMDATKWLQNALVIYKINVSNKSDSWKHIKVNKKENMEDQSKQGRRPRITWDALYPQISEHCEKIFEGTFEDLFTISHETAQ